MDIAGCDNVIFTLTSPQNVLGRFLESLRSRWPHALCSVGWGPSEYVECSTLSPEKLPSAREVFIVRDEQMRQHFDDNSYVAGPDGEGPFALLVRERQQVVFKLPNLEEMEARDRRPNEVDPYSAWLCTPFVWELTTVTPADPDTDAFSNWVVEAARRACLQDR